MSKKALVLSGGSVRGAFQAGAISAVLNTGFTPDLIYGISAGALNAACLASKAGEKKAAGKELNAETWSDIGKELVQVWRNDVKEPKDLIQTRNTLGVLFKILSKNYEGIVKVDPLKKLLRNNVDVNMIRASGLDFTIGAVDLLGGDIEYPQISESELFDYILASATIPLLMPATEIRNRPYYDGGLRDIVPLKKVIKNPEVSELMVILTQPEQFPTKGEEHNSNFNPKNFFSLADRIVSIMLNEILVNDLKLLQEVNKSINELGGTPTSGLEGKRPIACTVIRPKQAFNIEITNFSERDILRLIQLGEQEAYSKTIIRPDGTRLDEEPIAA